MTNTTALSASNDAPAPPVGRPVAIVVLTWNAMEYTQKCYESIRSNTDYRGYRLIFIDNGSTDGSAEWLADLAEVEDDVTVVRNRENRGFTKGVNQGINLCTPDEDVVLLNNDIVLTDGSWLARLQEVAYSADDIAIVGSRLVDETGRVNHLGSYMQPVEMYGQQIGGNQSDVHQGTGVREVESVIFALAYITRRCITRIGVLDEALFAYFEDTDYCLRALRAGMRVMYCGDVSPIHFHNTSTRENKVDFWTVYNKSRHYFEKKWSRWLDVDRYETEVNWNSVLHSPLGYAVGSQKLMTELHYAGVRVSFKNAYGGHEEPSDDPLVSDFALRRPSSDAIHVAYSQADAFGRLSGRYKVGYSMLEVTGLPQSWVDGCNKMNEVWVPASFNVETFQASGVRVPIHVMPLGVDDVYFNEGIRGHRATDSFTFLSVFEWGERKAPEVLLRAFANEFSPSDDVTLLVSVFNRDPTIDVEKEIAKLDLPASARIVVMVNPEFAGYQMGSLYRSADCFVLPSRGEGWGQPVLEAMACGLPTIATGWGGVADFLDEEVGYPVEYKMVPAEARCVYYDGFEWAEPDEEHLMARMRQVVAAQDVAKIRAGLAAKRVAERFTWRHAAERISGRLREIG